MKCYSGHKVEQMVLKAIEGLREALKGDDPMKTCRRSRDLFFTMFSMTAYPGVWSEERVDEAIELLQQAVNATVGTEVHDNCAPRPAEFQKHAELTQQRREALEALV